jgi:hypothetical protein
MIIGKNRARSHRLRVVASPVASHQGANDRASREADYPFGETDHVNARSSCARSARRATPSRGCAASSRRDGRRPPQLLPRHARGARCSPRAAPGVGARAEVRGGAARSLRSQDPHRHVPHEVRPCRPARRRPRRGETSSTTSASSRSIRRPRRDVRLGDRILFDDGRLVLTVKAIEGERVRVPRRPGRRHARPRRRAPSRARRCASRRSPRRTSKTSSFGLSSGVDYIAMSFVRRAEDIHRSARSARPGARRRPVIAKIETPGRRGEPREHRRGERRRHGGARRSRRGVPARARAGHPAADPRTWRGACGGRSSSRPRCSSR